MRCVNPVRAVVPHSCKVHFNIIHLPEPSFPSGCPTEVFLHINFASHPLSFDHPVGIQRRIEIWCSLVHSFLQTAVTSSSLGPGIPLSCLISEHTVSVFP
jgi:hypothetical protein